MFSAIGYAQSGLWNGIITFDPIQTSFSKTGNTFGATIGAYRSVHENVQLGFGGGIVEDWKFSGAPQMPLFFGLHSEFPVDKFTPTFDLDFGYNLNFQDFDRGSIFLNPIVGVRFGNFGFGVGYMGGKVLLDGYKWASSMNVRFSYYFNYHKTAASENLRKNLNFSVAYSYDFIGSFGKVEDKNRKPSSRPSMGIDLALLYSMSENFSFGPTAGFHVMEYNFPVGTGPQNERWTSTSSNSWIPVALRGKYDFKQVSENIYPWVQLDLGGAIAVDSDITSSFYFSPGIGVSKSVRGGKSSIDLGLSYSMLKNVSQNYNDDNVTVSLLKLSLGYTF